MLQIPSRLPREQELPSPDRKGNTGVVNTVFRNSNMLHLHQHVCHEIGDAMVRTSRFTEKLREWIQNHPPAQASSLNNSERLVRILKKSVSYGSRFIIARKRRKLRQSVLRILTDYHGLPRVWLTRFRTTLKRTTLKRRWIFKGASKNIAFTMRVKPGLLEKQQWQRRHDIQEQIRVFQRIQTDSWMTHVEKTLFFTAEASNLWIGRYSRQTIRRTQADHSTKYDELRKDSSQEHNSSKPLSTKSMLYCRSWTRCKRKEAKDVVRGGCTQDKHFLYHGGCKIWPLGVYSLSRQRCQRSRSNCRYRELEEGESLNSMTTWAKRKRLNLLVHNTETNFGKAKAIITNQSTTRGCESCQRRWTRKSFTRQLTPWDQKKHSETLEGCGAPERSIICMKWGSKSKSTS